MKAIIEKQRFDTETAEFIGRTSSLGFDGAESMSDLGYWEAGLYKAPRSGTYFLAGRRGPKTCFAKQVGQTGTSAGECIIPLTDDDAYAWVERNLDIETLEREFSDMIEDV